jgi:DNA-binding GntR family transcriptional regulator
VKRLLGMKVAEPTEGATRTGRSEATYATIRDRILRHDIRPGEHVTIDSVARALDVSQTPVREALARLEADGLLQKEQFRGYSATPLLTPEGFAELFDFRMHLEPWAASEAARNAGSADSARLDLELSTVELQLEQFYETLDGQAAAGLDQLYRILSEHDVRFHSMVAELSGNKYLEGAYNSAHCHLHLFRLYLSARSVVASQSDSARAAFDQHYSPAHASSTLGEHRDIVGSIRAGEGSRAAEQMADHLRGSRARAGLELEIVVAGSAPVAE